MMISHEHVKVCMGKWVICHTRYGDYRGRVEACGGDHVILYSPRGRIVPSSASSKTRGGRYTSNQDSLQVTPVYFGAPGYGGFGYGYGGYGIGRVAIPLAAIFGLTLIGASALWW
ncbi:hypothetical protein [Collibacillus ludicampi]|uniref:hypothetical protein n=1 Tax=Collibacillus ludicampi TaxID=2771369 RepID=UPI0024953808|nr:hypothetical protein [Collibacillus ludicampi]